MRTAKLREILHSDSEGHPKQEWGEVFLRLIFIKKINILFIVANISLSHYLKQF